MKLNEMEENLKKTLKAAGEEIDKKLESLQRSKVQPMVFLSTPEGYAPARASGSAAKSAPASGAPPASTKFSGWDMVAQQVQAAAKAVEKSSNPYLNAWAAFSTPEDR